MTPDFDAIRPYDDHEVREVLDRLGKNKEFRDALVRLRMPRLSKFAGGALRPVLALFAGRKLQKRFASIKTVKDFQMAVGPLLKDQLEKSAEILSASGLKALDTDAAYLFISNHRDIAMDPAMVNWQLHENGHDTLRIAIGDNLLSKDYVSDLMRLNKSFIVNRSAKSPREKLKAAKLLSQYIHHSVAADNENVWIAQREGRAKNGYDLTNQAVLSMLALSKPKTQGLSEFIRELNIVPVAISYEFDPCDLAKAIEVSEKEEHGEYEKQEHEDVRSIAAGIDGFKGDIHVHFSEPLTGDYDSVEEITAEIDRKIHHGYVLHLSNVLAYWQLNPEAYEEARINDKHPLQALTVTSKHLPLFADDTLRLLEESQPMFAARMAAIPETYRTKVLQAYAKPMEIKLA